MDREQIIRMAREAGCKPFRSPEHWDDVQVFATPDVLERFAALVDAAARAEENEACAKVCEEIEMNMWEEYKIDRNPHFSSGSDGATVCATAIRARGDSETHR